MWERLDGWLEAAPSSFDQDKVHEENLRYLLGERFRFDQAWEQTLTSFHEVARRVAQDHGDPLILRAIVPLEDAAELALGVPDLPVLLDDVSDYTPPMLLLMPPRLAIDHRRFEAYRVGLVNDLDAAVTYSAARFLECPHDDVWMRSLIIERSVCADGLSWAGSA